MRRNIILKLCLLAFVLLFACAKKEVGKHEKVEVCSEQGKVIEANKLQENVILVMSDVSEIYCSQCFRDIKKIGKKLRENLDSPLSVALVLPFDKDRIINAKSQAELFETMLSQDTLLFDIKKADGKYSLATKYQVRSYPSVLLIKQGTVKYLSAEELFDRGETAKYYDVMKKFFE